MATVSNENLNTASPTNDTFSASSRQWQDMNQSWEGTPGTWANPQDFSNDTINSASLTNNGYSD